MSNKKRKINGRFPEPDCPGMSIFVYGGLALLLSETVIFAIPFGWMCVKKIRERTLAKRFVRFAHILGSRTSASVRELAMTENWTEDGVRKDLRQMLDLGWFGDNAFLNQGEGMLIVPARAQTEDPRKWASMVKELFDLLKSESTKPHEQAEKRAENVSAKVKTPPAKPKQAPEKPAASQEKPAQPRRSAEPRELYIDRLERILTELNDLNEKIEDEAVSARIDRIGILTADIFRVVIGNPKREEDVRKFMNYYLPTTLKLLKSYDMLEDDRVQSENIVASRKKIESMLDRLIEAFSQLHDRLYSSDRLDLETDMEVLETMMASDGLTDKGRMRMPSH